MSGRTLCAADLQGALLAWAPPWLPGMPASWSGLFCSEMNPAHPNYSVKTHVTCHGAQKYSSEGKLSVRQANNKGAVRVTPASRPWGNSRSEAGVQQANCRTDTLDFNTGTVYTDSGSHTGQWDVRRPMAALAHQLPIAAAVMLPCALLTSPGSCSLRSRA